MNTYIITIMDNCTFNTRDKEVEAETAQDAICMTELNSIDESFSGDGSKSHRIYGIVAKKKDNEKNIDIGNWQKLKDSEPPKHLRIFTVDMDKNSPSIIDNVYLGNGKFTIISHIPTHWTDIISLPERTNQDISR